MSAHSSLEVTLKEILRVINPSRDDWAVRFHVIEEIRAVVQSVESLRGATVEPYGSFVSNLFTRWGDLDISIELLVGSYISSAGKRHKQRLLVEVLNALRKKGAWCKLQFISNARVPILKLESNYRSISCDISINNLNGQMKSKLLFWINEIDGRFRDMVLLVKEWAKAHDINDSKSGSMNSYSLTLLVIFHFQTCVPAILPSMKEIYPGNMIHNLTGVRTVAEKHIRDTCDVNINRFRSNRFRRINQSSLSELFISLLAKFFDISVRASNQGINPYTGQWEDIESNMTWHPRTFALFIEDPFEQPLNAARSVSTKQLERIEEAFRSTYHMLTSANQSQSSLYAMLIRQERLLSVTRAWGRNPINHGDNYSRTHPSNHGDNTRTQPSNRGENPRTHPQVRSAYSPSVGQQPQNTRVDKRPNATMQRPVQKPGPQQHMWKPKSDR